MQFALNCLVDFSLNNEFTQKVSQQPTLFMSVYFETELPVSACCGHHQAPVQNVNIETLLSESEGLPLHSGAKMCSTVCT
jgi:hypothetical protein